MKSFSARPIVGLTLGVIATLITMLTLLKSHVSFLGFWSTEAHDQRSLDLVLFNNWVHPSIWYGPITNTVGNVAMFMPVGFLLYFLFRRRSLPIITVIGFCTSLCIEVAQYAFAVGYSDVDDLLFNTLGTLLGGWLALKLPPTWRGPIIALILCGSLTVVSILIAS